MEWAEIELRVFGAGDSAEGYFCRLNGRVKWKISTTP
jgi:hypothetical protein